MSRPRVEILYFDGCPNHESARELVERIAAGLPVEPELVLVEVPDAAAARRLRFLGSPSVRVNGVDVEPGANERRDFVFSCRVYAIEQRVSGQPADEWVRSALGEATVASVLGAAEIPASKLGAARPSRLSPPERELYFWILRRFATRGRPSGADTRGAAARLGLDADAALGTLAREDLVHLDEAGEIAVAYPFSGRSTAHVVRFPSARETYAMCAIDALGIAPMFDQHVAVSSRDPISGDEIRVELAPSGEADWSPTSAVVVVGAVSTAGESCQSCCPVLNFFASHDSADGWLEEHPHVRGHAITIPEAILAGAAVFGGVLEEN